MNDRRDPGVEGSDHDSFEDWYDAVQEWHAQADRDADSILQIAETVAQNTGVEIQKEVEYGDPAQAVLETVDRIQADHVVLGSHSRDERARLLLGSVAQAVVHQSIVPVTVIR